MRKLKYIINEFRWIKALFSPFKPFTVKLYCGKTAIGVPYFLPRKWVDDKDKPGYMKAVPLTVGFSYCGLGWKTKWREDDFRYEYGPVLSFVFFGYQIALMVGFRDKEAVDAYWECWLYYEYMTDKTRPSYERISKCRDKFPQTYIRYNKDGSKTTIEYYDRILKSKYK